MPLQAERDERDAIRGWEIANDPIPGHNAFTIDRILVCKQQEAADDPKSSARQA